MESLLYTLRDLIDSDLKIRLVSGSEGEMDRPISSGQLLHDLDATQIRSDELAMVPEPSEIPRTSGKEFVDQIVARGAAALAYPAGTGQNPWLLAAVAEAGAKNLPVVEINALTRFSDIAEHIYRGSNSPDLTRFQRLVAMQNLLIDSLHSENPAQVIVDRLAKLCDASVGITRTGGIVEATAGILPFVLFRDEIGESTTPVVELRVAGWLGLAVLASDVTDPSQRWVIVASRRTRFPDEYVRSAASVAASVVRASGRIELLTLKQDRAVRDALLVEALGLKPQDNAADLASRVSALGVTFAQEVRVVTIVDNSRRSKHGAHAASISDRLYVLFDDRSFSVMVTEREEDTVILVQGPQARIADSLRKLAKSDPALVIGIGRPTTHIGAVPASHHDALLAAQHARRGGGERVLSYDDFEFSTRLLAHVGSEQMSLWSAEVLQSLDTKPILMEALLGYFAHDFDIMNAAKALHVHHNSLRYRLGKVEEMVGGSLRTPAVIASLHLAIVARAAIQDDTQSEKKTVKPGKPRKPNSRIDSAAIDSPVSAFMEESGERSLGATLPHD